MKTNNKNSSVINFICSQHKEKCSFVCLLRTCNNAFKVGCSKCKKEHAQHPNRLVPILDFHNMLGKPIKYLQDISAFKLMNLKKKIEFIRNFRGYILQKQIELIQSNKNIKSIISSLLDQHYMIRDTVSHLDTDSLINNHQQYIANLSKCKDFLAYNPVKCQLVFNNQIIKNSRISLEKQIKSSHELIDSIRQFLVKIIEVLLANCAHDEDDEDIQFIQEGDDKTNFNIYIKNRIDVIQNPNIKSKLEHSTFLQMFDEQKEALTKEVELLEKQITTKSTILKKIKSLSCKDQQQQIFLMNNSKYQSHNNLIQNLHSQNEQLKYEICLMKKQSNQKQNDDTLMNEKLNQIKKYYQEKLHKQSLQINKIQQYCHGLQQQLKEKQKQQKDVKEILALNDDKFKKYENQLNNEKENIKQLNNELKKNAKAYQQKLKQIKVENNKLSQEIVSFQKKNKAVELELKKKRQECEIQKAAKLALQQKNLRYTEIQLKNSKLSDQLEKKERQISKLNKNIQQNEKQLDKLKENAIFYDRQTLKIKQQYSNKEKMLKMQLDKYHKENEVLKIKSKNEEQRCKNSENRMKETLKQIQYKNELIRQKDKIIRQKQQNWNNKNQLHLSRVKELQNELKNSRNVEPYNKHQEQSKKYKQLKEMFEMSIKKNQELKDKNYELQMQVQMIKIKKLEDQKKNSFYSASLANGKHSSQGSGQRKSLLYQQKVETNNSSLFMPESIKIQTVNSQQYVNSPKKQTQGQPLKQIKVSINKYQRKQAYTQIKNLFNTVSEDMGILEERLKENSVIEKVYLKQLERKRNENKNLKKEIQSMKVYGGNTKHQSQVNRSIIHKINIQKDKNDNATPNSGTNVPTEVGKGQQNIYIARKKSKN